MKYTRAKLKVWLESLPNEPFCEEHMCPISQYLDCDCQSAAMLDLELSVRIDDLATQQGSFGKGWPYMLPSDVLGIMSELE